MAKIFPPIIFGTACLGDLHKVTSFEQKKEIVAACVNAGGEDLMFESAGKYGAGTSLKDLGKCLTELGVDKVKVRIINQLGWFRIPLSANQPILEKNICFGLEYDALQKISYGGILDCYHQGENLLGDYHSDYVSIHDLDEYLSAAHDPKDYLLKIQHILDGYQALHDLKKQGLIKYVGIGSKDWEIIQMISLFVSLDFVMIANCLTIYSHPVKLVDFVRKLADQNIPIVNSAIFNGGFLTGGEFYNYRKIDAEDAGDAVLLGWRNAFFALCKKYDVQPEEACTVYVMRIYGIKSITFCTTRPEQVAANLQLVNKKINEKFWIEVSALQ